jgi:ribosomal-protein-alanine N-acetyltransferase
MFEDALIETDRLFLRPFTMADLSSFRAIASEEAVLRFLPPSDRMTPEQMHAVLNWLTRCYKTNTREHIEKFTLPMVLKNSGKIAGWCGLGSLEFDESQVELYFVVSGEHWGKGLATEAGAALLKYAFGELSLRRVVAVVNPGNRASVRVIEKLGMRREGPVKGMRPEHVHYEGHVLYSMGARDHFRMLQTSD